MYRISIKQNDIMIHMKNEIDMRKDNILNNVSFMLFNVKVHYKSTCIASKEKEEGK